MLSPSDTLIIFVVALLLFGPEQLPKIARQLGEAMRGMQATTHQFMLEMDRAASTDHAPSKELPALPEPEREVDPQSDAGPTPG